MELVGDDFLIIRIRLQETAAEFQVLEFVDLVHVVVSPITSVQSTLFKLSHLPVQVTLFKFVVPFACSDGLIQVVPFASSDHLILVVDPWTYLKLLSHLPVQLTLFKLLFHLPARRETGLF